MRDQLVGYMLGALDAPEHERFEEELSKDPQLAAELEALHECLNPLRCDDGHFEPPDGLAEATCACVAQHCAEELAATPAPEVEAVSLEELPVRARWSLVDLAVAAGIVIAAAVVFFPTVSHSRFHARLAACQNKLATLGSALREFSLYDEKGSFPSVTSDDGQIAAAGLYATRLVQDRFVTDPTAFVCPDSWLAKRESGFSVPTMAALEKASPEERRDLLGTAGGSYGYSLGHIENGQYRPTQNRYRSTFALMSDSPCPLLSGDHKQTRNHCGSGQNVLFEDGRVAYLTTCQSKNCTDKNFFLNEAGQVAAGMHTEDSVIGHSSANPFLVTPVAGERGALSP